MAEKDVIEQTDAYRIPPDVSKGTRVPTWLAALVLVLLVAVIVTGGLVARATLSARDVASSTADDVRRWSATVASRPSDVGAHLKLAYALQTDKRYPEALKEYKKVLVQSPRETAALYNMGLIHLTVGDAKTGEDELWQVLKIDPLNSLAAKDLGDYYVAAGHYKSALYAVRPVVQARPTLADLQCVLGVCYEKLGKSAWAGERYRLALKYEPDLRDARDGLQRLGIAAK